MKALAIAAVILSVLGFFSSVVGIWGAAIANHAFDVLMDSTDGPITTEQLPAIKATGAAFADVLMYQGISVGAFTIAWIGFAMKFRSLYRKALAVPKES